MAPIPNTVSKVVISIVYTIFVLLLMACFAIMHSARPCGPNWPPYSPMVDNRQVIELWRKKNHVSGGPSLCVNCLPTPEAITGMASPDENSYTAAWRCTRYDSNSFSPSVLTFPNKRRPRFHPVALTLFRGATLTDLQTSVQSAVKVPFPPLHPCFFFMVFFWEGQLRKSLNGCFV